MVVPTPGHYKLCEQNFPETLTEKDNEATFVCKGGWTAHPKQNEATIFSGKIDLISKYIDNLTSFCFETEQKAMIWTNESGLSEGWERRKLN